MGRNDGGESPQRLVSGLPSQTGSYKMKRNITDRKPKSVSANRPSILQKRLNMRVIDNGEDVTPKLLVHNDYPAIEDKQFIAFDHIGGSLSASNSFLNVTSSMFGGLRASSFNVMTSSIQPATLGCEEIHMDSLLSTQKEEEPLEEEEEKAPSLFHLSEY